MRRDTLSQGRVTLCQIGCVTGGVYISVGDIPLVTAQETQRDTRSQCHKWEVEREH